MVDGKVYTEKDNLSCLKEDIQNLLPEEKELIIPIKSGTLICCMKDQKDGVCLILRCRKEKDVYHIYMNSNSDSIEYLMDGSIRMLLNYLFQSNDTCILCLPNKEYIMKLCIQIGFKLLEKNHSFINVIICKGTFYQKKC